MSWANVKRKHRGGRRSDRNRSDSNVAKGDDGDKRRNGGRSRRGGRHDVPSTGTAQKRRGPSSKGRGNPRSKHTPEEPSAEEREAIARKEIEQKNALFMAERHRMVREVAAKYAELAEETLENDAKGGGGQQSVEEDGLDAMLVANRMYASYRNQWSLASQALPEGSNLVDSLVVDHESHEEKTAAKIVDATHGLCLICFCEIKREEAVWQCGLAVSMGMDETSNHGCHRLFHGLCVQKWAHSELLRLEQQAERIPDETHRSSMLHSIAWHCPACRKEYPCPAPSSFHCFCGKVNHVERTIRDAWLAPHSCGQPCGLPLPGCRHACLLTCHPGECPPCPRTVEAECHCGAEEQVRRCLDALWSCEEECGAPLSCGRHHCEAPCHPPPCPPCPKESLTSCACGAEQRMRPCNSETFRCKRVCGAPLACGRHTCKQRCHRAGECPPCPGSLPRKCFCGKKEMKRRCDKPISSCGDSCDRLLPCGKHRCTERCHPGECPPCRLLVRKRCECGKSERELPCFQPFRCQKRCTEMRSCGRHPCKRKCCPEGGCPPCTLTCGRWLRCRNHRCEMLCHQGDCLPCSETVVLRCYCESTALTIPCGAERTTKPPACRKLCPIPPTCHHPSRMPHRCHMGPCDPCNMLCGKMHSDCGHTCKRVCHDPLPIDFKLTKKQQKVRPRIYPRPMTLDRVECPPCEVPVIRACKGRHAAEPRPCHTPKEYSCGSTCGNLLRCGVHRCTRECHPITRRRKLDADGVKVIDADEPSFDGEEVCHNDQDDEDTCETCNLPCMRPRECSHPCAMECHVGDCPVCEETVKMRCHCRVMPLYIPCHKTKHDSEYMESVLCCGNKCKRQLPHCTHLCASICHRGECPAASPGVCEKSVKISCMCGLHRKKVQCKEAQRLREQKMLVCGHEVKSDFTKLLSCTEECEEKAKIISNKREQERKARELKRNADGAQRSNRDLRRRKNRGIPKTSSRWKEEKPKDDSKWMLYTFIGFVAMVLMLIWAMYFGFIAYGEEGAQSQSTMNDDAAWEQEWQSGL